MQTKSALLYMICCRIFGACSCQHNIETQSATDNGLRLSKIWATITGQWAPPAHLPTANENPDSPLKVLIIGGGIVGLTLAQGCRKNGIPYTLYEQDTPGSRPQGWALTLHWCLKALERTVGSKCTDALNNAVVDKTLKHDTGNFLFMNAATCEVKYKIPPSKRRLRLHRQKLKDALLAGIVDHIETGKKLQSISRSEVDGSVTAHFSDGTTATGTLVVGADGNNSVVRKHLLPDAYQLSRLPVALVGVVRPFTPEQAAPVRALDPLLFQALDPETGNYLWYSTQELNEEPNGRVSTEALVIISWLVKDEAADAIPPTNAERIRVMKRRAQNFAEPLRSNVMDIPDDLDYTTPLRLGDFSCPGWDNLGGHVTLAGDAAHAMTMYRGEGANHGILDAALLVDQLKRVAKGDATQKEALDVYETELRERTHSAVLLSRRAALDAHDWDKVNEESPIIGARMAPATALL